MGLRVSHRPSHHERHKSTPVIDAIGTVVAFASVVIGGYAGLFLIMAAAARRWDVAADCALFFVFIALANALVDAARRWSRHHG
jgi:formate-dependent nitrite reductase membrane component NrfD